MATQANLVDLVPAIYDAGLDGTLWRDVLAGLVERLGGHCGSLICRRTDGSGGSCVEIGFDPEALTQFFGYFAHRNVLLQRGLDRPAGTVVSDRDLLPKEEFRRSEYYNELLLKHEDTDSVLSAFVWRDPDKFVVFNCNRSPRQPEFAEEQKEVVRALLPHLSRAVAVAVRLGGLETQASCDRALLDNAAQGVLVLDERGAVQYANRIADRLLRQGDGLAQGPDGLVAATAGLTAELRLAVVRAASGQDGGAIALARPRLGRPLYVSATPLSAEAAWLEPAQRRVLLLLRDPAERPALMEQHLHHLFGMTPAEARLAIRLYEGDDLAAAAAALRISRHTARAHLNAILGKTDSPRQSELMRRLVTLAELASGCGPVAAGQDRR
jgi:DNA-binding CsgD family transcriptional regulator